MEEIYVLTRQYNLPVVAKPALDRLLYAIREKRFPKGVTVREFITKAILLSNSIYGRQYRVSNPKALVPEVERAFIHFRRNNARILV